MQDNYAEWLSQGTAKPSSEKMPAEWALKEAQRRAGLPDLALSGLPQWQVEFARMIEKHEQPPVDPDVIALRHAIGAWEGYGEANLKPLIEGKRDNCPGFQAAIAAFRKHKEAGE